MSIRKRENAGNWKRKHYTAICGELALEAAIDLSYDKLQVNEHKGILKTV
jgi:hypothetical protein